MSNSNIDNSILPPFRTFNLYCYIDMGILYHIALNMSNIFFRTLCGEGGDLWSVVLKIWY